MGTKTMKIVCAWCGRLLGFKPGCGEEGSSHGMCRACAEALLVKVRQAAAVRHEHPDGASHRARPGHGDLS